MSERANYIRGYGGVKITFLDLQPNQIRVNDIFLHLAKTCRFHGLLDGWYSNAEHSVLGTQKASTNRIAREFLIHDFGEMITNDVAGPVKTACPDYDALCKYTQGYMNQHFLGYTNIGPEVKEIDVRICATEMRDIRNQPDEDLEGEPYENHRFWMYEWRDAYQVLKDRFAELFPEYKDHA